MIYVTHDQVEAMTMGDRIVVLNQGYVQQIDTPLGLYDHPANKFVAGFIGSPAMNFIEETMVRQDGLRFRAAGDERFTLSLGEMADRDVRAYEGRSVILGIRPEDIYVTGSPYITNPVASARLLLDVMEPMGNEIFLYARTPGHEVVARVAPQPLPDPGQPVALAFDLTKLHFFDPQTEEAILAGDRARAENVLATGGAGGP